MSSDLISDVIERVEDSIKVDRNAVVNELAMQLTGGDCFMGGVGEESVGVESAVDEIDNATWQAAVHAVEQAADIKAHGEAKELALRLIRALAATATKEEATSAA